MEGEATRAFMVVLKGLEIVTITDGMDLKAQAVTDSLLLLPP